jgi:CsoR family transcriptional regulator, copper-sensing transcriptional repressor
MSKEFQAKTDIVKRMRYAEGHLRGVIKLVEADAYCMDIINQNHAVIEALKKVNQLILEGYLGECAWDAMTAKEASKRKKAIGELVRLYSKK